MHDKFQTVIVLSLMILVNPLEAVSQTGGKKSAVAETDTSRSSKHSFFAITGIGSNMIYLGSTISQDQPYGFGALSYGFKNGLYVTASAVHLAERSPFAAFYTGTVSYSHVFSSWFDISTGLSGYGVAPSLTDTLFNSFLYGDFTAGFDWKILYTKVSAGAVFSGGAGVYFQVRNSRFFQTPEFSSRKFTVSFDPYINVLAGPMTKTESKTGTVVTMSPPYKKGQSHPQGTLSSETTTYYGIMEADLGVPVSFNADRFTVEAEPSYIIPLYDDPEYPDIKGFNFTLSFYLRIF